MNLPSNCHCRILPSADGECPWHRLGSILPCRSGRDSAADCAAAEFFQAENGLFQLRLLGQHGAAKPPAKQATGDVLRANAVQVCECKAACVVDIVASIV